MSDRDRLDQIGDAIAELRGQFEMFLQHAATKTDIAEVKTDIAEVKASLQQKMAPALTPKQRTALLTSIATAIAAAGSALYALFSK